MDKIALGNNLSAQWDGGALVVTADDLLIQTRLDTSNLFMASVHILRTLRDAGARDYNTALTPEAVVAHVGNRHFLLSHATQALKQLELVGTVSSRYPGAGARRYWLNEKVLSS